MDVPSPRVPLELLELIVDYIRDDDVDDMDFCSDFDEYRTLRACCLVCRTLLPRSRGNLLRRVRIMDMRQLASFAWMIDTVVEHRPLVRELTVLSIAEKPSPAESCAPVLASKLPQLRCLRLRTEMGPVLDPTMRPVLEMHRGAFASLSSFKQLDELQLFGLRFSQFKHFLRLVSSAPQLSVLQCMQLWFNPPKTGSTSDLFIPTHPPVHRLRLYHVDVSHSSPPRLFCR